MYTENISDFEQLAVTETACITDAQMPQALRFVANHLKVDEAMLTVALTGAEAPSEPWKNPELIASLQSLITSRRAIEGIAVELVGDYEAIVYGSIDEDSLDELARRAMMLAHSVKQYQEQHQTYAVWAAQESLLTSTQGILDDWAARRLGRLVDTNPPKITVEYDRKTCVRVFEEAQQRALAARDLYSKVMADTIQREQEALALLEEEVAEEEAFNASEIADEIDPVMPQNFYAYDEIDEDIDVESFEE